MRACIVKGTVMLRGLMGACILLMSTQALANLSVPKLGCNATFAILLEKANGGFWLLEQRQEKSGAWVSLGVKQAGTHIITVDHIGRYYYRARRVKMTAAGGSEVSPADGWYFRGPVRVSAATAIACEGILVEGVKQHA